MTTNDWLTQETSFDFDRAVTEHAAAYAEPQVALLAHCHNLPPADAAKHAARLFFAREGRRPTAAYFNPQDAPQTCSVDGIRVSTDASVSPGFVRVE